MSDEFTAQPGLTPNVGLTPIVQPMTVRAADVAPVASVLPPARGAAGLVQIAGLGQIVQGVRDMIGSVRTNGAALQESVTALNMTLTGLKQQVDATHDDLKFEASTLGNGSGS